MKHASLMYTCMGLMTVAGLVGFIDYSKAKKAGSLKNLYKEDIATVSLLDNKIEIDDYSRGPIEYEKNETYLSAGGDTMIQPPKVIRKVDKRAKTKKLPPPPPPKIKKGEVPPPPPPKKQVAGVSTEIVPAISAVPAIEVIEVKKFTTELVEVPEVKQEPIYERFSRAPLPKVRKKSKNN